jgi:regulator of PEP synthase PpsR (kinase-PPPase family)
MPHRKRVFFISDRTGITVEALGSSLLTQFADLDFMRMTLPFIDTVEKAREVVIQVNEAHKESGQRAIVFSSIVDDAVRTEINKADGLVLDVFERFIVPLENELGTKSMHAVGLTHSVSNVKDYNHRIEAINYTLSHDDGVTHRGLEDADIVLVGVSRSGKTPTCLYLAMQFGIKAANYPLIPEDLEANKLPSTLVPLMGKGKVCSRSRPTACTASAASAVPTPSTRRWRTPLRGIRGREADAPWDPVPRLDDEVDRGDRDPHAHEAHSSAGSIDAEFV